MRNVIDLYKYKNAKHEKKSIKDFHIDTSHYKSNSPKIIKVIDIKF